MALLKEEEYELFDEDEIDEEIERLKKQNKKGGLWTILGFSLSQFFILLAGLFSFVIVADVYDSTDVQFGGAFLVIGFLMDALIDRYIDYNNLFIKILKWIIALSHGFLFVILTISLLMGLSYFNIEGFIVYIGYGMVILSLLKKFFRGSK